MHFRAGGVLEMCWHLGNGGHQLWRWRNCEQAHEFLLAMQSTAHICCCNWLAPMARLFAWLFFRARHQPQALSREGVEHAVVSHHPGHAGLFHRRKDLP